jgi:polar amino acid transport system permease protein
MGGLMGYTLNFNLIWRHFDKLWGGLLLSLELAVAAIAIGSLIGLALAIAHVSGGRVVRTLISAYVEFIRNVPLILLVYLVFYGLPQAVDLAYDATTSFVVTLSLYSGAYLVEVFRSGLAAVPAGLIDAGKAIGLTPWQRLLHVRLPTMLRITLPALSNTFVSLFKDTSVASVIAVPELTYGAQWINTNTFRIVEVYLVVTVMYLVTGYAILIGLRAIERRFAIGR